jgi:RNA polymerase sigma-70 factor (ECF subfamily)
MDKYPPQDKIILKMRMDGYTNTEIADHLGLSEKTIRNKYSLIIKASGGKLKILTIFYFFLGT